MSATIRSTDRPLPEQRFPEGGWPFGEVVEPIGDPVVGGRLLLPALRTLIRDDRWVTLIAPPLAFVGALRHRAGIDATRFRRQTRTRRPLADTARAVSAGTSSAVLVWAESIDVAAIAALRTAVAGRAVRVAVLHPGAGTDRPVGSLRLAVETTPAGSPTVRRLLECDEDRVLLDPSERSTPSRCTPPDRPAAVSP